MSEARHVLLSATFATTALAIGIAAGSARAGCNEIPELRTQSWQGYKGTVDTVFGRPDTPSSSTNPDPRHVWVGSNSCNPTQLADKNYVVTVIFKPPGNGPRNIVALTAQENCSALSCDGGQSYLCVPKSKNPDLEKSSDLEVFPGTDNKLRFRFPSSTFTGPALIAVTRASEPLPCTLANQGCRDPGGPANLFACVDEIFEAGSCSDLDPTFPHFTALPPMNDWQEVCDDAHGENPPCKNSATEVRFTVDEAGNILLPVSWAGIVAEKNGIRCKKNRVIEGRTKIPKTKGGSGPVVIPDNTFLDSFTPRGVTWPSRPKFDAHTQGRWLVFSGETDVCESVLRVSRRNCVGKTSGKHRRKSCTSDSQCKSDETCGGSRFDFSDRLKDGVGPVRIPKSEFKGQAKKYKPKP